MTGIRLHSERTPRDYRLTMAEVEAIMDEVTEVIGKYSQDTQIGGNLAFGHFEIFFPMKQSPQPPWKAL